jgi:hypothetical protein
MEAGPLGYTVALGLPELRAGIAALYRRWYGVDLNPDRVIVTAGSSAPSFWPSPRCLMRATGWAGGTGLSQLSPDPARAVADPGGPARFSRGEPVAARACRSGGGGDGGADRRLARQSHGHHAGPRGAGRAYRRGAGRGISFVSDEIYHGLHYGDRAVSALEITDEVYVINSFSKYFSMTGWRIGWMVVPEDHVRTVERLAQNMFICPPHASQIAALAALEAVDELEANRAVYAENRRLMLERVAAGGLYPDRAARRGLLHLCRCVGPDRGQPFPCRPDPGSGRGGGDAGAGFRSRARGAAPCAFPMRAPRHMKTFTATPADIDKKWILIDAEGVVLGASPRSSPCACAASTSRPSRRTWTWATT